MRERQRTKGENAVKNLFTESKDEKEEDSFDERETR